ncbi:MAG TPA: hypothetical protein VK844_00010 [Hyphomicrobiales bacterium]|nr:hypothetical protein [Hyphomicrobiales bacterium]
MTGADRRSFVDGPGARIVALLLIAGCLGVLAYLHRETLFPGEEPQAAAAANPQLAACLAERIGAVDRMKAEGVVNDAQYAAFRARAEAYCEQQFGGGTGPPPPR